MQRKILLGVLAGTFACLIALGGCAQQGSSGSSSGTDTSSSSSGSGASSSTETVALDNQGAMNVFLDYNAGTGYEWQCAVDPENVLTILRQETLDKADEENTTGGPLQDVVSVMAVEPGTATLTCELVRPWETDEEPAEVQTFVFTVDADLQISFDEGASDYQNPPEEFFFS